MAENDRSVLGTDVELPSRGLPYGDKLPGGVVRVTPWTTREQMLIAGSNPAQSLPAINTLLDRCTPTLTEVGLRSVDLITADRVFLLIMARTVSHGQSYPVRVKCTVCGLQVPHTFRLPDDMEMRFLPDNWSQPFETLLPVSNARVQLRLLRGHDDMDIERYKESLVRQDQGDIIGDPTYAYRMSKHVVSVTYPDGRVVENRTKGDMGSVHAWYQSLHAMDDAEVRNTVAEHDCGFDTYAELSCIRCSNIFEVGLPLSIEFFRPGRQRERPPGRAVDLNSHRRSDVGRSGSDGAVATSADPDQVPGPETTGGGSPSAADGGRGSDEGAAAGGGVRSF